MGCANFVKSFTGMVAMPDERKSGSRYSGLRSASMLLAIPALLIISPLVGAWIGSWLDRRLKSLHEATVEEPLPDDMAKMLGRPRS